jgi:F-type H+-transporting ATPase subunit delta
LKILTKGCLLVAIIHDRFLYLKMKDNKGMEGDIKEIVRRYSIALFRLAEEGSVVEQISKELEMLCEIFTLSSGNYKFFSSPLVSKNKLAQILCKVLEEQKFSALLPRFCSVLIKNGRFNLLYQIAVEYKLIGSAEKGEKIVELISATPVPDLKLEELKVKLKELIGGKVKITVDIDSKLLGGMIIKHDSKMYDGSLANKIRNLGVVGKKKIMSL